MTDELTRAAKAVSEATGLDVQTIYPHKGGIGIAAGRERSRGQGTVPEVLAYLEGLEVGARIQKERHAVLVFLVESVLNWWTQAKVPLRQEALIVPNGEQTIGEALTEALSQLEG